MDGLAKAKPLHARCPVVRCDRANNRELIACFEKKIETAIARVWGVAGEAAAEAVAA